jgi:hypothetical protein
MEDKRFIEQQHVSLPIPNIIQDKPATTMDKQVNFVEQLPPSCSDIKRSTGECPKDQIYFICFNDTFFKLFE